MNSQNTPQQADEKRKLSEAKIQADCFLWFNNSFPHLRGLLYHVPNGEKRDPVTANKLKAMGVVAGIPDIVFHYRARTYFFEFKKPETGKASKAQKKVHEALDKQRFIVWLVDSIEAFQYLIKSIIEDESQQFTHGLKKEDYYYKHKIFDFLYNLGDGELVEVSEICEEESRPKFINFISEFIVEGFAKLEGFEILFTPDYRAFYKRGKNSTKEIIYNGTKVA
jgi:hypothetical protein